MSLASIPFPFNVSTSALAFWLFWARASLALGDWVSTPSTTRRVSGVPLTRPAPRAPARQSHVMTTTPDLTASPDDQSKPTLTGAVPLVPLGRPQVAAAVRLAAGAARHPVRLAAAGLSLTGELASAARGVTRHEP